MNRKDLIDLYHGVEEAEYERRRLGDQGDANSKYVMLLLAGLRDLVGHAIEDQRKATKAAANAKNKKA